MITKYVVKWLTGKFAKRLLIILLERMVQATDTDVDDKLLEDVKKALKES